MAIAVAERPWNGILCHMVMNSFVNKARCQDGMWMSFNPMEYLEDYVRAG